MSRFKELPDTEFLRATFSYQKSEGVLRWRKSLGSRSVIGKPAGWKKENGYFVVEINGSNYYTHRVIWKIVTGEDPGDLEIDHKDVNPSNNKWRNLRLACRYGNMRNTKLKKTNSSGYKGVYWNTAAEMWQAYITENGKSKYLGVYGTPEAAAEAVRAYRAKLHGEFTNHG